MAAKSYLSMRPRNLVSQADQAYIENARVPRSKFRNQWTRKTAFNAGYLVPILCDEILPGDHMSYDVAAYLRMATPLFPLLDNQEVSTFFFFVPNRILWPNWAKFMGEQDNPGDSIAYTIPTVPITTSTNVDDIYDHFGINRNMLTTTKSINSLPFRAYNLIYNQWFRDENVVTGAQLGFGDGPDTLAMFALRKRAKAHDYFTSALPWPQKFTAPNVPVAGIAPVTGFGVDHRGWTEAANQTAYETDGTAHVYPRSSLGGGALITGGLDAGTGSNFRMSVDSTTGYPKVYADLSQATGVAINTLRQAFLVQQLLERDARGGTRYTEKIRSHFGVINPDFRLQRPEYIGGGKTPLMITPVAQTTPATAGSTPLGNLGAAGTASGRHRASYAATEHGYIIGLINVRSEISYQQGIHRMWTRSTMYDFYFPSLAGLGEQTILRQELYATGDPTNDAVVFGYQERWQEYRTKYSEITGIMKSTSSGTLDGWHLAQRFTSAPVLNQTFIEDTPPMDRVLAAANNADHQQYLADIMYTRTAVRPLPTFGTPVTLGRF